MVVAGKGREYEGYLCNDRPQLFDFTPASAHRYRGQSHWRLENDAGVKGLDGVDHPHR
jgi:hypothetical protein